MEHFCVHGPGDVEGRPLLRDASDGLPLDDEFAVFVVDAYALNERGRRLYDSVFLSRAKGRAKSELAGLLALWEGMGPCRFAGWAEGGEVLKWRDFRYVYVAGEPMGRPVTYPFVRCLATEETQAGNTYDNVYFNLTEGPLAEGLAKNAAGLTRIFLPNGGEIVPSTASSSAKDGGKETFTVFDETHLYHSPELRRMYVTVDRNCRKRRESTPWALQTSTMYQPGEDSIAERTHARARAILDGRVRESRLLFDHREAPADVDLTDKAAVVEALGEVYGPFAAQMDLDGIVENEFWNVEKDVEDSRRYFFNQPTAARDAWMTHPDWAACADPERVVADGDTIVMFFDGSKNDDATGLVGCRVDDGHVFVLGCWEKPEQADGWEVPRAEVDVAVRQAFDRFDVVAFYADVREFEQYVDDWGAAFRDLLLVDATRGAHPHPVAWDMRAKTADFTAACARFLVDVDDRAVSHDGDSRLRRHILNARRAPNKWGVSISKSGRESPDKIDLAVCAVGARQARRDVIDSGKLAKRRVRTGKASFL
jgi:hypothetical protein